MVNYYIIQNSIKQSIDCIFFDSIESTNDYLLKQPFNNKTQLCFASEQTKGKGQQGRVWQSQKYGSILFSIKKLFNQNLNINGLSLVVALAIINSIENICKIKNLGIKWPNDIYCANKKLSGILIENQSYNEFNSAVIGVGINYNIDKELDCDNDWIDLKTMNNNIENIETITAQVINNILLFIDKFEKHSFKFFKKEWELYDMLKGRTATLNKAGKIFNGKVAGVNDYGALIISNNNSSETIYSSEHISYNSKI